MEALKVGDWVRTRSNLKGKIVMLSRMSAFVEFQGEGARGPISYLLSELTKIEPPQPPKTNPSSAH